MTIREKIKVIQKMSGLSQTEIARKLGVSFVSLNNWYNGKAKPRAQKESLINELYLENTGQKEITEDHLKDKKAIADTKRRKHKNILKEILLNPDIKDEFLLKLTYHSNGIEGSKLTENETAAVIFNNTALPNRSLIEQLEAKNHEAALNYIFEYVFNGGKITEELILRIHSILMNGIISNVGSYRHHAVRIVGAEVPTANYIKIPSLMADLIEKINRKETDIIAHVSFIHSSFEQIHPFSDGNGRAGRMMMQAMLLKNNFAPAVIRQEKKYLYYAYLNKSQLKGDASQLENFICDAIIDGFDIVERKII